MECEIDGDVAFVNDDKQQLDNSLILIGVSPIKVHGVAKHQRVVTAKRKLAKAYTKMEEGVAMAYGLNIDNFSVASTFSCHDTDKKKQMILIN